MLKELTIRNFKSFKDETTFSMEADPENICEYKEHIVDVNGNKLLKVASVYGPNGGGKTNLIDALNLPLHVLTGCPAEYKNLSCVFSEDGKIEETIVFVDGQYEIAYNFTVSEEKETHSGKDEAHPQKSVNKLHIIEENISYRKKGEDDFSLLCTRHEDGTAEGGGLPADQKNNDLKLAKTMSVITYLYDFLKDGGCGESGVIGHLYGQIHSITELDALNREDKTGFPYGKREIDIIKRNKDKLIRLLNRADIKISDIIIRENGQSTICFLRDIKGGRVREELPLESESEGTGKIFNMFLSIAEHAEKGGIFYCDNMNASLHPALCRALIGFFQTNKTETQFIFNSHDIQNMTSGLFRRDEIWFAYRDCGYSTVLIPLSNILNYAGKRIKPDADYYRQYSEGKYGAYPFIPEGF